MSSIPLVALQVRPPADVTDRIRNVVSLSNMMQQQAQAKQDSQARTQQAQQEAQLRKQQLQQGQAAQQDQDVWRQAYRDNNGDPDKTMTQAIKNGASAASIEAFQRHQAVLKSQLAQTDEVELRNMGTRYGNLRNLLEPFRDEMDEDADKPPGQEGAPPKDMVSGAYPGQSPISISNMMLGKGGQWQGDQPGPAEQTQGGRTKRKQDLWSKQRELVLAHPDPYGITDLNQVPLEYPGDDFVRDLYATVAGGHKLVRQDLDRRRAGAAPGSTDSPTGMWIRQKGQWVPYYGK